MSKKSINLSCPCGSDKYYKACCGLYHTGEAAPTAEALMRSRWSAFALGKGEYLYDTLAADHPDRQMPRAAAARELPTTGALREAAAAARSPLPAAGRGGV